MRVTFDPPKKKDATSDDGIRVGYAPAKRLAFRLRWYAILLLTFTPVIISIWYLGREWWLVQAPAIITTEPQLVVANGDGFITDVYKKPGQQVLKGEVLMRFDSPTLKANIAGRKARLAELEIDKASAQQEIMAILDARVRIAEDAALEQESIYREYTAYKEGKLVTSSEYLTALLTWTQSRIALEQARAEKIEQELLIREDQLTGPLASSRDTLLKELTEMEAKTRQQQPLAPTTGKVTDVLVQEGDWVFSTTPLALISKLEDPQVIAYVAPKYLPFVETGKAVVVKLPSGEGLSAKVARPVELADSLPSQLAEPFEGDKATLKVTIALDDPLPANLQVEGLPITVFFGHRANGLVASGMRTISGLRDKAVLMGQQVSLYPEP
jgi:multidrug resistance efflux pump